jgi:hypothetical protein
MVRNQTKPEADDSAGLGAPTQQTRGSGAVILQVPVVNTSSQKRRSLVPVLRSFADDTTLLSGFRSTFESRCRLAWLGEGFEKDNRVNSIRRALEDALSQVKEPRGDIVADSTDDAPLNAFRSDFRKAAEALSDAIVDRYFIALEYSGIEVSSRERIARAIRGSLEHYVRNRDSGLSADPW